MESRKDSLFLQDRDFIVVQGCIPPECMFQMQWINWEDHYEWPISKWWALIGWDSLHIPTN